MTDYKFNVHIRRTYDTTRWDVRISKRHVTLYEHFSGLMPYRRAQRWIRKSKREIDAMLSLEEYNAEG